MRKTMSVSVEENVIKLGREGAYEARVSFSRFVEEAIRLRVDGEILEGMKKRPVKPKEIIEDDPGGVALPEDVKRKERSDKISADEEAMLRKSQANGQAKYDADRAKRDIKKERLASGRDILTKEPVKGLMGHSGPLTKASQVGKKGK